MLCRKKTMLFCLITFFIMSAVAEGEILASGPSNGLKKVENEAFTSVAVNSDNAQDEYVLPTNNKSVFVRYRLKKYDVIGIVIANGSSNQGMLNGDEISTDVLGDVSLGNRNTGNNKKNPSETAYGNVTIGPDGYVNLSLIGSQKLEGLTVQEAEALLKEKMGEYIKIKDLRVIIYEYSDRTIYVAGEVVKPGVYSLKIDDLNIFAAISMAGGVKTKGRAKHIIIVSKNDGRISSREVDLQSFISKQDFSQDLNLQDGDMVFVPKSNKIDFNEDVMPLLNWFNLYYSVKNAK